LFQAKWIQVIFHMLHTESRASAGKFPGGGGGNGKKQKRIAKISKNSTIKPLPERGQRKKDRNIALLSLFLYICTMYENLRRGARPLSLPLPTPMYRIEFDLLTNVQNQSYAIS